MCQVTAWTSGGLGGPSSSSPGHSVGLSRVAWSYWDDLVFSEQERQAGLFSGCQIHAHAQFWELNSRKPPPGSLIPILTCSPTRAGTHLCSELGLRTP